jgi:hypothetical protein
MTAAFIIELIAELAREVVTIAMAPDPVEAERLALLRTQRRISDEIAKRELE